MGPKVLTMRFMKLQGVHAGKRPLGLCGPLNVTCPLFCAYSGQSLFEEIASGFQNVLKSVDLLLPKT